MKILSLSLENFQGIRSFSLDLCGNSAEIFGDNATGKTTIYNAFTWLLFGKSSTGAKNFSPKTRSGSDDLHNVDHAVEASIELPGGTHMRLRKVFHEIYRRKRGSATEEFSGHGTDYFIDGVPTSESAYNGTLERICGGAEVMKMLSMVDYFPEGMTWSARRKLLIEICGDISDNDVIAENDELHAFLELLQKPGASALADRYSVEDFQAILRRQMADVNKQLQIIPSRIDEAKRAIPDIGSVGGQTVAQLDQSIESIRAEIAMQENAKSAGGDSVAKSDAAKRLLEAEKAMTEAERVFTEAAREQYAGQSEKQRELSSKIQTAKLELSGCNSKSTQKSRDIANLTAQRDALVKKYNAKASEAWAGDTICAVCQQPLPLDQIENAKAAFNLQKSQALEAINKDGQHCSQGEINKHTAELRALEARAAELAPEIDGYEKELAIVEAQIAAAPRFADSDEYALLTRSIEEAKAASLRVQSSASQSVQEVDAQIQRLRDRLCGVEESKAKLQQSEKQTARVAELDAEEKKLSAQYEKMEQSMFLCDTFVRTKASMLTQRINEHFRHVCFRLFVDQINGGQKEDCEVMIPTPSGTLVPFATANNAARINAGLEIIGVLSRHFGVSLPVFVDNAESVTALDSSGIGQLISLVVSAVDPELRMEVA